MGKAKATLDLPGFRASEAEALWYDRTRWPTFVDGFANVVSTQGDWPQAPSTLVWQSTAAGRGRVVERVTRYEPRVGQTVQVDDPKISGEQQISFSPKGEGVKVEMTLEYELKEGGPLRPVLDLFFVRRAMNDSLKRTLARFGLELRSEAEFMGGKEGVS